MKTDRLYLLSCFISGCVCRTLDSCNHCLFRTILLH